MKAEYMYYAVFSAALMGGAEPALAQKIGYKMAYLASTSPKRNPTLPKEENRRDDVTSFAPSQALTHRVRPINPLNHVDWIQGGVLNQRGLQMGAAMKPRTFQAAKRCYTIKEPVNHREDIPETFYKLNRAIMLAKTQLDSLSLSKFCTALYQYQDESYGKNGELGFWMLMHAVRCYLFGTTFQWEKRYEHSTNLRQSTKPMFSIVKKLQSLLTNDENEPQLWQCLFEQVSYFPVAQQIQCLTMGLAYRSELIDPSDLAHEPHRQFMNIDDLEPAQRWFNKG